MLFVPFLETKVHFGPKGSILGPMARDPRGKPAPGRTATVTPAANGARGGVRGLPRCAPAPHAGAFIRAPTCLGLVLVCPIFSLLTKNGIFFWPGPFGDTSHGVREPNPAPNLQQDGAAARFWGPLPLSHYTYDRKPMTVSELRVRTRTRTKRTSLQPNEYPIIST